MENKSMMIVLLVIVVLVIGVIMYQSSQQADKDRQLQLQIASMGQGGSASGSNFWDSMGSWGTILDSLNLGGLFNGGGDNGGDDDGVIVGGDGSEGWGDTDPMALASYGSPNSDASIGVTQGLAAINGMQNDLYYASLVDNPYDNFGY